MHARMDLYGKFGQTNLFCAIHKEIKHALVLNRLHYDVEDDAKKVPDEVGNLLRLAGSGMEVIPTMVDYGHFSEGTFLMFNCETMYTYTLQQAVQ